MAVPKEKVDTSGIEIHANWAGYESVLTPAALAFLTQLHRGFNARRQALLLSRRERQAGYDAGGLPNFREDTKTIRDSDWRSRRSLPHCRIAASRSPVRSNAR
jgi:malate synthase